MASFQPTTKGQNINPFRGDLTRSDLLSLRRQLAKRANQRLVRLERATSNITGENFASYGAAEKAKLYLENRGRNRFTETLNVKWNVTGIRREIAELQNFLNAKSSTVQGQRDIERRRVETFQKGQWGDRYKRTGQTGPGISFASNKEFYNFLNSSTFKELIQAGFTSGTIIEALELGGLKKGLDETIQNLQKASEEFQERGNASIKELRKQLGIKPLTGG